MFSEIYGQKNNSDKFKERIWNEHNSHDNFNLFINRSKKFEKEGRIHNLDESIEIDNQIKSMLEENLVYYGNYYHKTVPVIVDNIITTLNRIQAQEIEDDEGMEL